MIGVVVDWSVHPGMVSSIRAMKRWLSMYIFSLQAFGGTDLITVRAPESSFGYDIVHQNVGSLREALDLYPRAEIVALVGARPDTITPTKLKDFKHPGGDTLYLVGGDYVDVDFDVLASYEDRCSYITIGTATPEFYSLWSHVCLGMALWDRYVKAQA